MGTPTGEAESGTVEDQELVAAGKSVAILVSSAPRAPLSGERLSERQRLDGYLAEVRESAIVLDYSDDGALVGHINNFLSRQRTVPAVGRVVEGE